MPIRGAILIFIIVAVFAVMFHNEIYDWIQRVFPDDENKDNEEEKDIYEEIEE